MVKVDLITGFLGAGKTTFIRKYADYFIRKGQKINIIENEFGNVSVDSIILKDEACDITQLSGGCMCCTAKVAFQNMLLDMSAGDMTASSSNHPVSMMSMNSLKSC